MKYLHGLSDAGSRLLFELWSRAHELNEKLAGTVVGKVGRSACCGYECESVSHVLWECPTYILVELISQLTYRVFLGWGRVSGFPVS